MKKTFKMLLAVILSLSLLLVTLPLTTLAQTTKTTKVSSKEDISYSDIIFSYSDYISETYVLHSYYNETQECFTRIKEDFMDSPKYILMSVKEGMKSLNLKDYFKAASDALADTDYTYEAALDKANILFAEKLLEAKSDTYSAAGTASDWVKNFEKIYDVYDIIQKFHKNSNPSNKAVIEKLFEVAQNLGLFENVTSSALSSLREKINTKLPDILSITGDILAAAKTLLVAMMIEDMRLGAIDEILTVAKSGAVYDGMSRLKYQLRNGLDSYFIDTYVKNTVLDKLIKFAEDIVLGKFLGNLGATINLVSGISSIAALVLFDVIIDVPNLDDLTSQMVLAQYAKEFYEFTIYQADTISDGLVYKNIQILGTLFASFGAATDAALEACDPLTTPDNQTYHAGMLDYLGFNIFKKVITSIEETILNTPEEEINRNYYDNIYVNDDYVFANEATDYIEENTIYCTDGVFNGNLVSNSTLSCPEDTAITVSGNIVVNNRHSLTIDGTLTITGNLILKSGSYSSDKSKLNMTLPDSKLILFGDFLSDSHACCNLTNGTIVFAGNSVQTVNYLDAYNITVLNPNGIRYPQSALNLKGHFDLNGNPLDQSYNSIFIAANTASFDPDSDFGRVTIGCDYTLKSDITAKISTYLYDITVPESADVTVNGSIWVDYPNQLTVDGKLTITGNLTLEAGSYSSDKSKLNMTLPDSKLILFGDFLSDSHTCCNLTNGTIVFAGNSVQTVNYLDAYNITVLNPNGIRYPQSAINLKGHFDLNGNPLDQSYNSIFIAANTASFDPDSDFGRVTIGCDYTLKNNITAKISTYLYDITVPESADVTVNGSIWVDYPNQLTVDGKLTITGNLTLEAGSYSSDISKVNLTNKDSVLAIGGNFAADNLKCCNLTNGKVILCGEAVQSTNRLTVGTLILENSSDEGVSLNNTYISNLFLHNGNNFTIISASFPDYDGDGLSDNLDDEPMVGNPCIITITPNDMAAGSVSETEFDTIGGTTHTVTATPCDKYSFVKWVNASGKIVSYDSEYTFVAKGDDTLTAVFEKRRHNITVNTQGGVITAPSNAAIESQVNVSFTEDEGYIYTEGSLCYNGIAIENGAFIMPDEPVTITAEFVYNPHYFTLKEKIAQAKVYTYEDYSATSFAALQSAINAAESVLENHITESVAKKHIEAIQGAIDSLKEKYVVSISVVSVPLIYIGVENAINQSEILITYDNSTTEYTIDYTVENFDCMQEGLQTVSFVYGGFSTETEIEVLLRPITGTVCEAIPDQIYLGAGIAICPDLQITFAPTEETLVKGRDYTVRYINNTKIGKAIAVITGMGYYEGSRVINYNIYCEHDYKTVEYSAPTCTENGYYNLECTLCGNTKYVDHHIETVYTENLPESNHNYNSSSNVTYTFSSEGALYLELLFSAETKLENNFDFIYIYDCNDVEIGKYTDTALASQSIRVEGDTVKIRLTSDGSVNFYGFSLNSITAVSINKELLATGHSDGEWITVTKPTISTEGFKHKVCTVCGEITAEETIEKLKFGDADLSGEINALDLTHIKRALLTNETDYEINPTCDTNGDGKINLIDLIRLKRYLANEDVSLGISA